MMPQATRTIVIARPQAEVFAFFADAENDPQWRPAVRSMKRDGPLAIGARYTQRIAGPGGRDIPADVEVTAYQPDVLVAFRAIAGPVRPEGSYSFAAVAGGTTVTFALAVELGGVKRLLMSKPVQKSMDGEMASLDRAKSLLESRG
jgi:uncharacterized protein YndB with AHSA1/START domain